METALNYYYLDIDKEAQAEEYRLLCDKLGGMGLKLFASISPSHNNHYKNHIEPLNGKQITLETKHLFSNQWNTGPTETSESGLRVFDWAEGIYPNRKIKEGQWLEQTTEMKEIRRNTLQCGYCGKQEPAAKGYVFCPHCLGSEYLKETELYLLRLLSVELHLPKRTELTEAEKNHLLPLYVENQTKSTDSRTKKLREKLQAEYNKRTQNASDEYHGFIWLLDQGVNVGNCIYYNHTGKFSFGWRTPVSDSVKSELLDILCEFQYDYEIK